MRLNASTDYAIRSYCISERVKNSILLETFFVYWYFSTISVADWL